MKKAVDIWRGEWYYNPRAADPAAKKAWKTKEIKGFLPWIRWFGKALVRTGNADASSWLTRRSHENEKKEIKKVVDKLESLW